MSEFGAGYWEDRYRAGEGTGRHDPSPALAELAADLPPGRALDAGCGLGADAVWLASRGWQVTAVDVSATALEHGRAADARVDWVHGDLTTWQPGSAFDLVSCQYVHVPGPAEELFRRLASWVAPGGTLLVVGHGHGAGHGHGHGHGAEHDHGAGRGHGAGGHDGPADHVVEPAPAARITSQEVTAALDGAEWDVTVAGPRTHTMTRPDAAAAVTLHDVVVCARRRDRPSAP